MPRTIRLKDWGTRMEKPAAGAITPGSLVVLSSADKFAINTVAAANVARIFALENELFGKGIDDNYAANDLVQAEQFDPGDWVLAYVAAAAAAIIIVDQLVADAAGGLRKLASGGPPAVAMDAIYNSGGRNLARIPVAIM